MSGSNAATATLTVTGAVSSPLTLTDATLASNYTPVTVSVGGVSYTGASVYSVIQSAKFTYSATAKNGALLDYLQVTGASGSQVVVSEGEVDPSFGGAASTDIIATQANGVAIAPELIVPGDGSTARDIGNVVNIQVATATVPASAISSANPPALVLSGAVSAAQTPYTAGTIQSLGTVAQTDTFLQGTAPKTYAFTGVPMLTVLSSAGLTSDIADSYVVAAGSDGYGVVYSGAEIDPAIRAGATPLVAYDDGTGTYPSVGGVAGALRTTAPVDSKGGRYVSSLDSLSVANAGASASIAGLTPAVGVYNAATAAAVTAALAALPNAATTAGSVSPDGSGFAAPVASAANIGIVSAPMAGSTIILPAAYQAIVAQGNAAATIADFSVGHAVLVANLGNDTLFDGAGSDTLIAGGGNTTLFGNAAGDVLIANAGTNALVLGAAGQTAFSQTGANRIFLGGSAAQVYSGTADTIIGGAGTATVFAGAADSVFSGAGGMVMVSGATATTLIGGAGAVTLYGGAGGGLAVGGKAGGNLLVAGTGATTLIGAASGDVLFGGANDVLAAGAGNETLAGSAAGGDVFSFTKGTVGGTDTLVGFRPGSDVIALNLYPASEPANAVAGSTQSGGSTILALSDGTRIIVQGVANLSTSSIV